MKRIAIEENSDSVTKIHFSFQRSIPEVVAPEKIKSVCRLNYESLQGFYEGNKLIKGGAPSFIKSPFLMPFAAFLVGVERDNRILRSALMRLQHDNRREEAVDTVIRLIGRPIPLLQRIGPDEFFVLDDFEITAGIRVILPVR